MKDIVKQTAGIDVAQKELVVSLGRMDQEMTIQIFAYKTFANSAKGFRALVVWAEKQGLAGVSTRYVMEATGVYHESLAHYLADGGFPVSIVMPNKISNYFRTLDVKTVTDKTSSQAIAQFGLERKLDNWVKPKQVFRELRQLTREREQLVTERTQLKNQLHAEQSEAFPNKKSITRLTRRIRLLNVQEVEIKEDLAELVNQDEGLIRQIGIITTIPGVGRLTAVTVLAETNGFELIRNKKQLVSYAGLDIKEKLSGTSVKGKPKISKKGNRYVRKAMYLPSLAAIRSLDGRYKAIFVRHVSKHGIKLKAAVAVQRKLLELIYILWKNNRVYDADFLINNNMQAA